MVSFQRTGSLRSDPLETTWLPLAGTTRPSVNEVLRAAQEEGVIRISRGSFEVLDKAKLTKRAH